MVRTHVMDAHGPLTHCTVSAGTRQAKNVGTASSGRQSPPVHTRVPGRNHTKIHGSELWIMSQSLAVMLSSTFPKMLRGLHDPM